MLKDIFKNKTINDTKIGQCSHIGLVRNYNKDACGCFNTTKGELFLVADGMGVQKDGIKAAQLAISVIRKYIDKHEAPMEELLINAILSADNAIVKASKRLLTHKNFTMGSTIVLLLFRGNTVYYMHIGDSRLYLLRNKKLLQLTRDHSQAQGLIDKGEVSKGEATVHSLRNELIQYLGCTLSATTLTVKKFKYKNSDKFLLCTDGLWDMVSEEEIKSTLETPTSLQEQADSLIKSALKAGGDDNIAVQIAQRQFVERSLFMLEDAIMMDISILSLEQEKKALELNRDLATREPYDTQAQKNVLVSLYKIGYIYFARYNFHAALKAYEEALEISLKLVQHNSNDKYWQGETATFLNCIAKIHKEEYSCSYENPLPLYRKSLKISRKLVRYDPSNTQWQGNMLISLFNIGEIFAFHGEEKKSLNAYHEALKISRKLAQLDPNNLQWQRSTIRSLYCIGIILHENSENDKALAVFQESLEMSRKLMMCDPSNIHRHRDVAAALHKIADILKAHGKFDKAQAIYQEAFEISSNIVKYDKRQGQWKSDNTWMDVYKFWQIFGFQFRSRNMLAPYEEVLEINRKLVSYDPDNIKWQTELASSLCDICKVFWMLDNYQLLWQAHEEALEISRKLMQHDPNNMQAKNSLAFAIYCTGVKFERNYNPQRALPIYQESLKIQRALVQYDSNNIQWNRQLATFLVCIGSQVYHYDKTHGRAKALALYQESIGIKRKLVQYEPEHLECQSSLANSLRITGNILIEQDEQKEALPLYQEALEISQNLEQDEPKNRTYKSYTARALGNIGYILLTQYKFDEAFAAFRECVEINHKVSFDARPKEQKKATNLLRVKSIKLSSQGKHDEAFYAILVCLKITRRIIFYAPDQDWKRYIVAHLGFIEKILKKDEIKKRFKLYSENTEFAQIVNHRISKQPKRYSSLW